MSGGCRDRITLEPCESSGRPLTQNQFDRLCSIAGGAMIVSGGNKRDWGSLHARGYVTGELGAQGCFINGIRITSAGLRVFADAVDRYGFPEVTHDRTRKLPRRVCGSCGSQYIRWERDGHA